MFSRLNFVLYNKTHKPTEISVGLFLFGRLIFMHIFGHVQKILGHVQKGLGRVQKVLKHVQKVLGHV